MKKKFLSLLLLLGIATTSLAGCGEKKTAEDYASKATLDMSSTTQKMEVTVKNYVDGDTTHFLVPSDFDEEGVEKGVLKARYIAVNTPESTGKIEEWGKKASKFTKEKLLSASSIILETDGDKWEVDSTGDRFLVWVWYKPEGSETYRNLNIELLQNGLAVGSSPENTRYGDLCADAIFSANEQDLHVYSQEKDPDYFYGEAFEVTPRELRINPEAYIGSNVAFEGIVTYNDNQGVYVESFDEDTQRYYGMFVYYGYNGLSGSGLKVLDLGNRVWIVGSFQYYETGNSYQVAGLEYHPFDKTNPKSIRKLDDEYHEAAHTLTELSAFKSTITVELEDGDQTFGFGELSWGSTLEVKNLQVTDVYTTKDGNSEGAMTLTCTDGKDTITVRTAVLYQVDENGETIRDAEGKPIVVTEDAFEGKTIDVKGIVDYYNDDDDVDDGEYQIKVFNMNRITIH